MEVFESGPFMGLLRNGYQCIVADPPWAFKTYSEKGLKKSPQMHYPCEDLDSIKAFPVADLAAPNCALILWSISPMMPHALEVLQAWGFTFKTKGTWAKETRDQQGLAFGTGHILRGASEDWLIGTRGSPKPRSKSIRNLFYEPRRQHSQKPEKIYEIAQELYDGPHLDLFSRQYRDGWHSWGNEQGLLSPPSLKRSLSLLENALDGLESAFAL